MSINQKPCGLILFTVLFFISVAASGFAGDALDDAFRDYWKARSPETRLKAAHKIINGNFPFDQVYDELKRGRDYFEKVQTGRRIVVTRNRKGQHYTLLSIPKSYQPKRRYPVRVLLHGGVARGPWDRNDQWWRGFDVSPDENYLTVVPSAWNASRWWEHSQVQNLTEVLDLVKRDYNVDENRVYLMGISDGGTGAYFFAFRETTPWAAFLPLIGHAGVLANGSLGVDGYMYASNLSNKPFFVVNGGYDHLYPIVSVLPYLKLFQDAGASITFRPRPREGHELSWWSEEAPFMENFIAENIRRPTPNRIVWETERTDRYNRAHWVIVDELGDVQGESYFKRYNTIRPLPRQPALGADVDRDSRNGVMVTLIQPASVAEAAGLQVGDRILEINSTATPDLKAFANMLSGVTFGVELPITITREGKRMERMLRFPQTIEAGAEKAAFPIDPKSGHIEVDHTNNMITVLTRGVKRYTLLLSPEMVDFGQPVTVITNGVVSYSETPKPSLETLLKWSSRDNDRTMLFAYELNIEVVPPSD